MPSPKELREQAGQIMPRLRELRDKANDAKKEWSAEDESNWKKLNEDFNGLIRRAEILERGEALDRLADEPARAEAPGREDARGSDVPPPERPKGDDDFEAPPEREAKPMERALAFQAWAANGTRGFRMTERHRQAAEICGVNLASHNLDIRILRDPMTFHRERRTAMSTTASYGGDTIPAGFVNRFEVALSEFGGVRQAAEILRTDGGNALTWPTSDDTSNEGAMVGENTDVGSDQGVTTSAMALGAYKYHSKPIKVSFELIQDNAVNLEMVLGGMIGERIGRRTNRDYTYGSGTSKPAGLTAKAYLGKTTASSQTLTADELLDLIYSVNVAYRRSASFMMNDAIMLVIRKLKDSQNRYIWQESFQLGQPERISGYPVYMNNHLPATFHYNYRLMTFGDHRYYKIRDVAGLRLRRLEERYAEYDQVAFLAFLRTDGDLLDAGGHPVKYLKIGKGSGTATGSGTGTGV